MSQTAINILLASWDENVVKELLKFRRIKVTKDIIKIVAFNTQHGEKIMQLLLDKELEDIYSELGAQALQGNSMGANRP